MKSEELDPRSRDILRDTVATFIATGEPVASGTLAKRPGRGLSPATIRSVLAELEAAGFLSRPHASAGRVPTDKGYRFYVDTAVPSRSLSPSERRRIDASLRGADATVPSLLRHASRLLADLADTVGFATGPDSLRDTLRHVDFVRLAPRRVLAVVVSETGRVVHRVVETTSALDDAELARCARDLETRFAGSTLQAARGALEAEAHRASGSAARLALARAAFASDSLRTDVYLEGTSRVLDKPEFRSNLERARQLLATLEEKERLVEILSACLEGDDLRIVIGSEAPVPDLEGLALIAARYGRRGRELGAVGIVGPTRMRYDRLVALVASTARSLSEAIRGEETAPPH